MAHDGCRGRCSARRTTWRPSNGPDGPIDPRTDVYAIGATLFHLLAGRPPFAATTRDELCTQHCDEPPPALETFNPTVGPGVARVVDRALSKRPEDRHIDAGALLRDLEALTPRRARRPGDPSQAAGL